MLYLDTSALVKLVLREAESDALGEAVRAAVSVASSVVATVELPRAVRRSTDHPQALEAAGRVLAGTELVLLTDAVIGRAAGLAPPTLRSVDAIHLASALLLEGEVTGFVAYDARLSAAAHEAGLPILAPA